MKTFLSFALCLLAVMAHAATPSTKSFRGTGGIGITSNDTTAIIIIDGSGISSPTGGVSAASVTNIVTGLRSYDGSSLTNLSPVTLSYPWNITNSGLIGDGDSLMDSASPSVPKLFPTLTNSFPGWRQFGAISNFAVSGAILTNLNQRWGSNVAPAIVAMKAMGLTNIFLLFNSGANDLTQPSSLYTVDWSNYVWRAKSSNVTVITLSITPQARTQMTPPAVSNFFLNNEYMRRSTLPDYFIDWARLFPNPSDTNVFADGTHLTTNSYYRAALAVDTALRNPPHQMADANTQTDIDREFYRLTTNGTPSIRLGPGGGAVSGSVGFLSPLYFSDMLQVEGALNFTGQNGVNAGVWTDSLGTYWDGSLNNLGIVSRGKIKLVTGGVADQGMVILANGNVGIGYTNPTIRLQVLGGIYTDLASPLAFYAGNGGLYSGGVVTNYFAGPVGLNTTSPTNRLDVQGSASIRTNLFLPGLPTNASPVAFLAVDAGGQVFETAVPAGGAGSTPGGNSGAIQFAEGTAFAGTNDVVWDRTNHFLTLKGGIKFSPDNTYSIGSSGSDRPSAVYAGVMQVIDYVSADRLFIGNNSRIKSSLGPGIITFYNANEDDFNRGNLGGNTAAFPAIGRQAGDLVVLGADGNAATSTNRLIAAGGLVVGPTNSTVTLTNVLYATATLDFPSTAAGTASDLPITVAGASDGNIVSLGIPTGSVGPLSGTYAAWASNGVVYVRYANNNLVTAQDPASGLFRVRVDKFK